MAPDQPSWIVHADADALRSLEAPWRELCDADPAATVFHRPEFLLSWWDEFDGAQPVIVEARAGDRIAGLAHVTVREEILRFLADPDLTDYLGPIGPDQDAVAQAVLAGALAIDGWRTAELEGLAADSGWPEALARAAKAAGLSVAEQQHDVCPRIALPGSYDGYLQTLPGKLRHEIRRKARRLEREAGSFSVRLSEPATLDRDLERFYEMHRSSTGPKGKFLHEGIASFFTRLAHTFADRGWLRLSWLEVEQRSIAAVLSFAHDGTWYVYNSAYDHAHRELGPGMVLMAETIRVAAEEGCATFDLLRGSEPYKYRFGARDVAVMRLTLGRG